MQVVGQEQPEQDLSARKILNELVAEISGTPSPEGAFACVKKTVEEKKLGPELWIDTLLKDLLFGYKSSPDETIPESVGLPIITMVVGLNAEKYLPIVAKAVHRQTQHATSLMNIDAEGALSISPSLLKVWMTPMLQTSQVSVHSQLSEALFTALPSQGPTLWKEALQILVEVWKASQASSSSGVVPVRCATTLLGFWKVGGDPVFQLSMETGALVFLQEVWDPSKSADPLNQLCVLDALVETWDTGSAMASTVPADIRDWLTNGDSVVKPLLGLLVDPLLSGTVLSVLSWICTLLSPTEGMTTSEEQQRRQKQLATIVMDFITNEIGVTTVEEDRLRVLQACARLAQNPVTLSLLLQHPGNACECWLDVSRMSSSKLQSAVMGSLSLAFKTMKMDGVRTLYLSLLRHNEIRDGSTTTDWILSKFVSSPFPEVQVAALTLWSDILDNALQPKPTLEEQESSATLAWNLLVGPSSMFLQWILAGDRPSTPEVRVAKFKVLCQFQKLSQKASSTAVTVSLSLTPSLSTEKLEQKLIELRSLGAHGIQPVAWTIATE